MSKLLSLTERIAITAGDTSAVEHVVSAHVAAGFHRSGSALVRGSLFSSYMGSDPFRWRTTAAVVVEQDSLNVTWSVNVSGQHLLLEEVDALREELQWTLSEHAPGAAPPPRRSFGFGDGAVAMARRSPGLVAFYLVMCLFCAGFALTSVAREDFPPYGRLDLASGEIDAVKYQGGLLRVRLRGDARVYAYNSKGGAASAVSHALSSTGTSVVSLRYEPIAFSPAIGTKIYPVWDIAVNGRPVRTYLEIKKACHDDNLLGVALGAVMLAMALLPAWMGVRALRRQQQRVKAEGA
ncbi:Hypothetical protein A7982_04023 [Minicystis rosea]|nr:Hypothetical protein A7982_04023 [Minicystis rosea]